MPLSDFVNKDTKGKRPLTPLTAVDDLFMKLYSLSNPWFGVQSAEVSDVDASLCNNHICSHACAGVHSTVRKWRYVYINVQGSPARSMHIMQMHDLFETGFFEGVCQ